MALAPLLVPVLRAALPQIPPDAVLALLVSETVIGILIGVMGRLFFLALQFMATAAAMFIGLSTMPGAPIEDAEPLPAFATLITLTATLLFFLTDQHWEVLRALLASYSALPDHRALRRRVQPGQAQPTPPPAPSSWRCRSARPFIVYTLIINLMVGIANKLTPQIPVYFISVPFGPRRRLLPALLHHRRVAAPLHDGLHGLAGEGVRAMSAQPARSTASSTSSSSCTASRSGSSPTSSARCEPSRPPSRT